MYTLVRYNQIKFCSTRLETYKTFYITGIWGALFSQSGALVRNFTTLTWQSGIESRKLL